MVILFGANGMLGKYVTEVLHPAHSIWEQNRKALDLTDLDATQKWLDSMLNDEDIIVNCAGVIPQRSDNIEEMVRVNTLFPMMLNKLPNRVIHISTDCVFTGKEFQLLTEGWKPDATDPYGVTKALGEPMSKTVIRTSIIGEGGGLMQWLIDVGEKNSDNRFVNGYTHHYWNGITCLQLARNIKKIIDGNLYWEGVRHMYSEDICNKFILLQYINDIYDLMVDIKPQGNPTSYVEQSVYRVLTTHFEFDRFGPEFWGIPSIPQQIKEQKDFRNVS